MDTLVLLEDATGKERGWLLAHPEADLGKLLMLQGLSLQQLEAKVKQRARHEPLAYIRGKTEFYGREFIINKDVLEPRPESETIITLLKTLLHHKSPISKEAPWKLIDVGTGSGALATTAKLEVAGAEVIATDIDPKCLVVAKKNAQRLGAEVKFFKGNLLEPIYTLLTTPYLLLCNLPYVPDDYQLNSAAMNEPRTAIFGGPDGLDLYRHLFEQIDSLPTKPQYVLTESLPLQHKNLATIAKKHGYKSARTTDFIQVFEILN